MKNYRVEYCSSPIIVCPIGMCCLRYFLSSWLLLISNPILLCTCNWSKWIWIAAWAQPNPTEHSTSRGINTSVGPLESGWALWDVMISRSSPHRHIALRAPHRHNYVALCGSSHVHKKNTIAHNPPTWAIDPCYVLWTWLTCWCWHSHRL